MKHACYLLFLIVFCLQSSSLNAIGEAITVSGSPGTFVINNAIAGNQPTPAINTTTTYNASIFLGTVRITGVLNSAMPTGVALSVNLVAPGTAISQGTVSLTTTAKNLVVGITSLTSATNLPITYTLSATVNAVQVTNGTRTVTYTIGA